MIWRYARAVAKGVWWYVTTIGQYWTDHPITGRRLRYNHQQAMVVARIPWCVLMHEKKAKDGLE